MSLGSRDVSSPQRHVSPRGAGQGATWVQKRDEWPSSPSSPRAIRCWCTTAMKLLFEEMNLLECHDGVLSVMDDDDMTTMEFHRRLLAACADGIISGNAVLVTMKPAELLVMDPARDGRPARLLIFDVPKGFHHKQGCGAATHYPLSVLVDKEGERVFVPLAQKAEDMKFRRLVNWANGVNVNQCPMVRLIEFDTRVYLERAGADNWWAHLKDEHGKDLSPCADLKERLAYWYAEAPDFIEAHLTLAESGYISADTTGGYANNFDVKGMATDLVRTLDLPPLPYDSPIFAFWDANRDIIYEKSQRAAFLYHDHVALRRRGEEMEVVCQAYGCTCNMGLWSHKLAGICSVHAKDDQVRFAAPCHHTPSLTPGLSQHRCTLPPAASCATAQRAGACTSSPPSPARAELATLVPPSEGDPPSAHASWRSVNAASRTARSATAQQESATNTLKSSRREAHLLHPQPLAHWPLPAPSVACTGSALLLISFSPPHFADDTGGRHRPPVLPGVPLLSPAGGL